MKIPFFQADAFTDNIFGGNPAGVCPLQAWLPNRIMQKIAAENNLAETAFFVQFDDRIEIKWFTPLAEVDLCGHATLASAHILFHHLDYQKEELKFSSKSGILEAKKTDDGICLDFPTDFSDPVPPPSGLYEAIGKEPLLCYQGKTDYMLIYPEEEDIININPDFTQLTKVEARGVIVSAKGKEVDFVSRFFAPQVGINEDPVTGSAHTTLAPYWSRQLVKQEMIAKQLSERGGELNVKMKGNRVEISGNAITYLEGEITIPD